MSSFRMILPAGPGPKAADDPEQSSRAEQHPAALSYPQSYPAPGLHAQSHVTAISDQPSYPLSYPSPAFGAQAYAAAVSDPQFYTAMAHYQPAYQPARSEIQTHLSLPLNTQTPLSEAFDIQPRDSQFFSAQSYLAVPFDSQYQAAQATPSGIQLDPALISDSQPSQATTSTNQKPNPPSNSSTPATTVACPKCDATCKDEKALRAHDRRFHQDKEKTICEYPGCPRKKKPFFWAKSYRRHMEAIHGIKVELQQPRNAAATATANGTAVTAAGTNSVVTATGSDNAATPARTDNAVTVARTDDAMQTYLKGAGNKLIPYVYKRKREEDETEPEVQPSEPSDISSLKNESDRLRQQLRRMQDELRVARATFEAELQEAEDKYRAELYEALEDHGHADGDQTARDEQRASLDRHEREMRLARERHGRNERRLWNLLKK
ncbi:hypothetical protein CONLIGDRAFT_687153 [Coniochaeta ligniaria NRRL 30616]|uniref:C2H2-type domain-containing protein n=1 Tax=Coniochaeta ligniaria NRRL 30616 TaxID=1408157 RepID=A0A1J7I5D1_9PEZI|nr:hypothetical protein CONLIGDRAFT_687153 [Coniochaeta ligniaria NRRL 30616]